jgi:hypothetical protein
MTRESQYFRKWETATCRRRIRSATPQDLCDLQAALADELSTRRPRETVCRALRAAIGIIQTSL